MSLNPDIHAAILPFAISDGTLRSVEFYLPRDNLSGLGSTVLHELATENGYLEPSRRTVVPAASIDQLVAAGRIGGIDLMKIDVEEGENAVLAGAGAAIRLFAPRLIMMETSNQSEAFHTLCSMGYSAYVLLPDRQTRAVPMERYWGNIFFKRGSASG